MAGTQLQINLLSCLCVESHQKGEIERQERLCSRSGYASTSFVSDDSYNWSGSFPCWLKIVGRKREERAKWTLFLHSVLSFRGYRRLTLHRQSLFRRNPRRVDNCFGDSAGTCCVTTAPERGTDGHSLIHVLALVSNCDCLSLVRMMKKGAKESPTLFFIHSPLRQTDAETGKYIFGVRKERDWRCRERDNPCHSQRWQQLESSDH